MTLFGENNGAYFSKCRKYRFALWRIWDDSKPLIMFIGLNPSTANEHEPDPTIKRVTKFAYKWGYGGFYMMNCFAFVTAYPKELFKPYAEIEENDRWLKLISERCSEIIFAWGTFEAAKYRAEELCEMFPNGKALVVNKDGSPRHPLYVKGDIVPKKYNFIV